MTPQSLATSALLSSKSQKVVKTPDFKLMEKMLHEHFSDTRIRGEWFHISLGVDYFTVIAEVRKSM